MFCHVCAAEECLVKVEVYFMWQKHKIKYSGKNTGGVNRMALVQVMLKSQGAHESIPLQKKTKNTDALLFISWMKFYFLMWSLLILQIKAINIWILLMRELLKTGHHIWLFVHVENLCLIAQKPQMLKITWDFSIRPKKRIPCFQIRLLIHDDT